MEQEYPVKIVMEILKNLPAKSLLRFRCVSKVWCSIIDDPCFIHSHHTRSHTRLDGINLIMVNYRGPGEFYSAHPEGGFVHRIPDLVSHVSYGQKLHHVNGLILITPYICNPSTRQRIRIPRIINFNNLNLEHREMKITPNYFLGFDSHTMRYKVLHQCLISGGCEPVVYKIWTVGTNEWRDVDGPVLNHYRFSDHHKTEHCYVDGVIYIANSSSRLLAFEVGPEKFRVMSLPPKRIPEYVPCPPHLLEVRGNLGVIGSNLKTIRMLEDYEKKVWKKQSFVMMYEGRSVVKDGVGVVQPIGTIHTGEVLFFIHSKRLKASKLFIWDLESKTSRIAELGEDISIGHRTKHVESLFRLENAP